LRLESRRGHYDLLHPREEQVQVVITLIEGNVTQYRVHASLPTGVEWEALRGCILVDDVLDAIDLYMKSWWGGSQKGELSLLRTVLDNNRYHIDINCMRKRIEELAVERERLETDILWLTKSIVETQEYIRKETGDDET
jgi:hypothetical protein